MIPNTAQLQSNSDLETAKKLLSKAQNLLPQRNYEQSIPLLKKAIEAFEAHEEWEGFMEAAYELSTIYIKVYELSLATQILEYALKIYQEKCPHLSVWKAHLYNNKGRVLERNSKIYEALICYDKVKEIALKEGINGFLLIDSILGQVACYLNLNKGIEAQQLLELASELVNKEKEENSLLMAEFYSLKGALESDLSNNYSLAKKYYKQAYELCAENDFYKKTSLCCKIGYIDAFLGEPEKGMAYCVKMTTKLNAQDSKLAKIQLVKVYKNMAEVFSILGDMGQALYYSENSLLLLEQLGEKHSLRAFSILSSITFTQLWINPSKGIECGERALEVGQKIFKDTNNKYGLIYRSLAICYKDTGDMNSALIYYQKALKVFRESLGENHNYTIDAYTNLGIFWTENKNYSEGLQYLRTALKNIKDKYGNTHPNIPNIYINMAYNFYLQEKPQKAFKHSHLALKAFLPNYQETNPFVLPNMTQCLLVVPRVFFIFLQERATILFSYFQVLEKEQSPETSKVLKASFYNCQFMADYIEALQKTLKSEDSQLFFASRTPSFYELAIKIALFLSKYLGKDSIAEQAFAFHERAKSLLLRSSIQENEAKLQAAIDPELLKQEKDFKNQIETYLKRIQKEEVKGAKKDEKALGEWKQKHFDALQSHQTLTERFEKDYPQYYQLKYDFQTISVSDLQADLADNTVVVSYFIGPELGYIFVMTPYDYEVVSFDVPEGFDQQIEAYLASIHAQNFKEFSRQSYALYCLLIQPIEDLIFDPFESELQHLVILPSGALHYLPFETLIRTAPKSNSSAFHQLEYLLKKYNIQYHYSATLYHQYLQKGKEKNPLLPSMPNVETPDFIGFAPIYTSDKAATQEILRGLATDYSRWVTRSNALEDGTLAPLPFSEKEVQNIEELFTQKGLKGQSFLYETATKNHFKTLATKAKYLHIAAHGLTNDEFPKLSGIVFHPTEKATEIHDSVLSMGEMYQLQLQADLVVLSSCESGIGRLQKGEGMMAMNRGFLHAGAKNVIYTLFKVLDKPSSELCEALFEEILEGKSYSEALRLAKLRLIEREDVDPKSWSGFVLLGA
ncbi:MAG: CHAT domain-containing protein [Chitinophagales bacterium]